MRYIGLIFSLMLFLTGCQSKSKTPGEIVAEYYKAGKFNGALLIAQNDQVIMDTVFGYRDFGTKAVLTKETPIYIASLSKPITALAILIAKEKGLIALEDKAGSFIEHIPPYARNVTIKQLLNHTSGIKDYENQLTQKGLTNKDVLQWLATRDGLAFEPGTKFQYSNSGYIILAAIIEQVSKMSYAEFIKENILAPLDMQHTYVFEANTAIPDKAKGYSRDKTLDDYAILTVGDGGIYATAGDLYKLDRALKTNQLLTASDVALLYQTPTLQDSTRSDYGLGWYVEVAAGGMAVHHTGGLAGFRSLFWSDLKNGNTVIALTNQGDAFPVFDFLDDLKEDQCKKLWSSSYLRIKFSQPEKKEFNGPYTSKLSSERLDLSIE